MHGSGTSSAVPITYQLGDMPNTPESIDSVGTSTPNNLPLVERSRSSSASLSATPAVEDAAAEVCAANARANATAAAEIAATAATEAQVVAIAAQAAATVAQALGNEAVHDEYPNANKILIGVAPERITRFQPSTATKMNQIFKNKVQEEGSNWTKVTPEMKDNYWEEFKKHFIWARGAEEEVKQCWKKTAGRRYRDFINDRKKEAMRRDYIPEAVWNKWKSEWNTPEALELSRKKSLARLGRNGQCSKHTGGSITASEHAILFKMKLKESRLAMSCLRSRIGVRTRLLSMRNRLPSMRHSMKKSWHYPNNLTSLPLLSTTMKSFWRLSVAQTREVVSMGWVHKPPQLVVKTRL